MLLSMTGFGEGRDRTPTAEVAVEARAVNNRHLKVTVRGTDPYPLLESEVEKVARRHVRRGSLHLQIRVDRQAPPADLSLNTAALRGYLRQVQAACDAAGLPEASAAGVFAGVLGLPGVAPESSRQGVTPPEDEWPAVERAIESALKALDGMRKTEGRAMAAELLALGDAIRAELGRVTAHLPAVTAAYRGRLLERVRAAVAEAGVTVGPDHLIRELALFADRSDVAEEVTRLSAHLDQYAALVKAGGEGAGRKLEFVVQEMGREANTLGSKAGDVVLSRHAVEIKATLEKVRELIQNVE